MNADNLLVVMLNANLTGIELLKSLGHFRLELLVNLSADASRPEEQIDENDTIVTPSTKLSVRPIAL